ncbi:hypothetical protein [Arthrobacter sp. RCC_34]|uniref:hypothetical protein n=1 Tax=Arthrobacter sp. RCC_34 TaxID=3239230 RepID=UPI0035241035
MTKPPLSRRRQLTPEQEARIEAYSAVPDTAPEAATEPPAAAPQTPPAEEVKSKGFNYRMTPTRHAQINAMRKADERSFQWMMDKLMELGIEQWEQGNR